MVYTSGGFTDGISEIGRVYLDPSSTSKSMLYLPPGWVPWLFLLFVLLLIARQGLCQKLLP